MKNILIHVPQPISASGYYRALLPYRHCHKQLESEGIKLHIADQIRIGSHYDAMILRRELDVDFLLHANQRRKKTGCKFIWDIDDDFWSVPDWSPVKYDRRTLECLDLAYELADEIWTSTAPLANKVGHYKDSFAYVMPNLADFDDWFPDYDRKKVGAGRISHFGKVRYGSYGNSQINILWSGSSTHRQDLAECHDTILKTAGKYGNKVKFHFYGFCPENIQAALFPTGMIYHKWTKLDDYCETMKSIQPTIALAPLQDNEFNNSKSCIRWLEATLAGAAVIASDCLAYKDASIKVDGKTTTWESALDELITSGGFFGKLGDVRMADHCKIATDWSWNSDKAKHWLEGFRRIAQ